MSSPRELILPPSGLLVKDDFAVNDAVADASIGELNWESVALTTADTYSYLTQTGVNNYGVLRMTGAGAADNTGSALRLFTDGLIVAPGTEFGFKVRYPNITGNLLATNNFRIGLQDSVTVTSPTVGVWFDSDAGVMSCQVDSADHGDESDTVTAHPDLTSGTTMVLDDWTEFKFVCAGAQSLNAQGGPSEVDFFINGAHVAKTTCNIDDDEEVELSIVHWQDSGGAESLELDVDYIWAWLPRYGLGN